MNIPGIWEESKIRASDSDGSPGFNDGRFGTRVNHGLTTCYFFWKTTMRNWRFLALVSFLCLQPAVADAEIIMAFTGTSGSSEITLTLSGTTTMSSLVSGTLFTNVFAPTDWFTETEFNPLFGSLPKNTSTVNLSSNLELRNASDNALIASFNQIQGSNSSAGDGWSLRSPVGFVLGGGQTFTGSGSATFTLGGGFTIDSIANGTYNNLTSFSSGEAPFTVTWNASPAAAVPEPSSMIVLALGSGAMGFYRLRRQRRAVSPSTMSSDV